MAEPLKNHYGPKIPKRIGGMIAAVYPAFNRRAFLRDALDGYEALELMPRGRHIARALHRHLPAAYPAAVKILLASLEAPGQARGSDLSTFLYLPHTFFVAEYGLDHLEISLQAQYELTQRFTAEFSIRPFLERHPEATLARLWTWASDPSEHVRRLVSEGTRPRLPWAPRLRAFQRDPVPVLALLELLKDDPALYVRRSVANNLNDIGKDHPALLAKVAGQWLKGASPERAWLVRHALRSAVKRAEPGALAVLGFGGAAQVEVSQARLSPKRIPMGGSVAISFSLTNTTAKQQRVLVDFRVHFVKANGSANPKVFKLKVVDLAPGQNISLSKTLSLAEMSTRKHYPGKHLVELVLNGTMSPLGSFELVKP
ncbi:MAG: DNA alkylation repair protein [Candidatus Latescibacteria bacterium]|nr:DNA alkylation repair protein [Candidatus Latescibacterota bacterium]